MMVKFLFRLSLVFVVKVNWGLFLSSHFKVYNVILPIQEDKFWSTQSGTHSLGSIWFQVSLCIWKISGRLTVIDNPWIHIFTSKNYAAWHHYFKPVAKILNNSCIGYFKVRSIFWPQKDIFNQLYWTKRRDIRIPPKGILAWLFKRVI